MTDKEMYKTLNNFTGAEKYLYMGLFFILILLLMIMLTDVFSGGAISVIKCTN